MGVERSEAISGLTRGAPRVLRLLEQAAQVFSQRLAFVTPAGGVTYQEAFARLLVLAECLAAKGQPGARVVIFMRNGLDSALLPLAARAAGLVSVPVNWRLSPLELHNIALSSDAQLIVHDRPSAETVAAMLRKVPSARVEVVCIEELGETAAACTSLISVLEADETALASIHFTSGTLGTPKGVMQSHRNWEAMWRNLMSVRDFRSSDVVALTGPLSHAAGTYVLPLLLSGSTILLPDSLDAEALATAFQRHGATIVQCVPTLLTRLVDSAAFCAAARPTLRLIIYGAESMPHATLRAAVEQFGPIIAQNYGLTEAMMTCATLPPDEHALAAPGNRRAAVRHGIVGRPYPFVELVIRRGDGSPVEDGDIGEITIRSPHVMIGYWRNPEATAEALRGGWLWTGDLARWTADGYVAMAGRRKDMIISGGMNIYPAEVQEFLSRLPGVRECAAFGVPSAAWGEELIAVVVLGREGRRDALHERARDDLGIRTPKRWIFADELPRTANGKVDYAVLRSLAEQEPAS